MQFKNFNIEAFLRDTWQQKPLLIRNPWQTWSNPLAPDELAGLACEEEVESRLINQSRDQWNVDHGPIPDTRFGQLGSKHWTLLVQAVDHFVPDVAALIEPFRFIPNWRIDDVMVSCAADGGGVGPHFDHYDVFLVQGLGKRRWQVGAMCDDASSLLPHDDLRLLAEFDAQDEWILEPGDILYVPPGISHNGVAVGDHCMTYSIGFRAPSRSELMAHWCDHLLGEMQDDDRYTDPNLSVQENSGEISASAIDRLHGMVSEKMLDRQEFARWFGEYSSMQKYPEIDWQPDDPIESVQLRERLSAGAPLCRNPASRFSFVRRDENSLLLFVDGRSFECAGEAKTFAEQLCSQARITIDPQLGNSESAMALTQTLFNQGSLAFEPEDSA